MAALIEEQTHVSATIVEGNRGEFSVWVDGRCVAKKDATIGFPTDDEILRVVSEALAR